ncbi:MAG: hypothetical protein U0V72_07470 [Cytophagales bacterium]
MKKITIFFIIMSLITTKAQVTVANLQNVPSALHPSMVGSAGNKRVTASYGVGIFDKYFNYGYKSSNHYGNSRLEQNNFTISYDQLLKKIGSGIGGYLNYGYIPKQSGAEYTYVEPYTSTSYHMFSSGISFAPKYNIMKKKNPEEVRFTWSPSIALSYFYNKYSFTTLIPENNTAELTPYNNQELYKKNVFSTEIGGLINSKKLMLGATIGYVKYNTINTNTYVSEDISSYTKLNKSKLRTSLLFGMSFPKKENSLIGYSFTYKLAIDWYNKSNLVLMYGNHNLRISKFIIGYAGSGIFQNYSNSLYVGYKVKNWKLTIGCTKSNKHWTLGETSFVYTFK